MLKISYSETSAFQEKAQLMLASITLYGIDSRNITQSMLVILQVHLEGFFYSKFSQYLPIIWQRYSRHHEADFYILFIYLGIISSFVRNFALKVYNRKQLMPSEMSSSFFLKITMFLQQLCNQTKLCASLELEIFFQKEICSVQYELKNPIYYRSMNSPCEVIGSPSLTSLSKFSEYKRADLTL